MFYKCLACGAVVLDPELNTWSCLVCGSENFCVLDAHADNIKLHAVQASPISGGNNGTSSTFRSGLPTNALLDGQSFK